MLFEGGTKLLFAFKYGNRKYIENFEETKSLLYNLLNFSQNKDSWPDSDDKDAEIYILLSDIIEGKDRADRPCQSNII